MNEPKTILRWLTGVAMFQATLIFLVHLVLTERLSTARSSLTDFLNKSQVASDQGDRVNEAFYSISSLTLWILIAGIALTGVGYGLLRSIVTKTWPAPNPTDLESS